MSGIEGVIWWLLDRRDNCIRWAEAKNGADRKGWEEDAAYFQAAAQLIAGAYPENQPKTEAVRHDHKEEPMVNPARQWPTVSCPVCGKIVAVRVPKGGDGSSGRPVAHSDRGARPCEGRFHDVDFSPYQFHADKAIS